MTWLWLALAAGLSPAQAQTPAPQISFVDATAASGIAFTHFNGWSGKRYLVETMGSGVCLFDADGDGAADVYLVQGAPTPGSARPEPAPANALFRNDGSGRFVDVTARAGVGDTGQGQGCTAGDYDADGDLDLYVVNFGTNVLYRNDGDGTFTDATTEAGVGDDHWGSSAAFADADGDGALDLYVVNYVDFRYDNHKYCGIEAENLQYYCSPKAYNAEPDVFYRNLGNGRFKDSTREAGLFNDADAKGLGVVWGDVDADGDQDIYVANDSTRNFLYRNDGTGKFKDVTLLAGVGYSEAGVPQAGMGVDFGDLENDSDLDLVVTNLSNETNELYRNLGKGIFADQTHKSGIASAGLLLVGFGVVWMDADNDGDLDLFGANGHIIDNVQDLSDVITFREPNHLFENLGGGRLREISAMAGPGMALQEVSRGLARADLDGDGDLDLVLSNNAGRAVVLRNETAGAGHWLRLRLRGKGSNGFAIGARAEVSAAGTTQIREVRTGSSYQSQSELVLHFGLGEATKVDAVKVRWPDGTLEVFAVEGVDRLAVLSQGAGNPASGK